MKFEIHIDATPAEARQFLGLPDLSSVHELWVEKLQRLAAEGPSSQDWQKLVKSWLGGVPAVGQGLEVWQTILKSAMQSPGKSSDNKD